MALNPGEMIRTLDVYGLTGLPTETDHPLGTDGWDSYPVPWDDVLVNDRRFNDRPADVNQDANEPLGSWSATGQTICEIASRNAHLPPPSDVDALAWYLPFHYFGLDWGIYVKEQSILEIAALIYIRMGQPKMTAKLSEDLCRMSLTVLYLHEALHHKVESFATRLEMATLTPVYRSYKDNVVKVVRNTDSHLEEAVACAEMLVRLDEVAYKKGVENRTRQATKRFLQAWIPQLNPGYRLGLEHLGDESKWILQSQVAEGCKNPIRSFTDWALADNMLRGFFDKDAIAYVIVPVGSRPIVPWLNAVEPLVSISTDRLVKHLRREFGYVEVAGRGKGGHRWFECSSGNRPSFPLPSNRESLSPVVLRNVAAALGYQSIRELAANC
jgi:hypothetical protein